ncbi:hypothetical protein FRB97_005170 [Tulasnella sp. 331]|nr:hypothetical protein FRB97_005170 [Tulasnella sp. 331]
MSNVYVSHATFQKSPRSTEFDRWFMRLAASKIATTTFSRTCQSTCEKLCYGRTGFVVTHRHVAIASSTVLDANHTTSRSLGTYAKSLERERSRLYEKEEPQIVASRSALSDRGSESVHLQGMSSKIMGLEIPENTKEGSLYPDSIKAYLSLRAKDPDRTFTFDLPPGYWLPILSSAQQFSRRKTSQMVLRDLIDCASRRPEKYEDLIFSIFELSSVPSSTKALGGVDAHPPTIIIDNQEVLNLFYSLPPSVFPGKHTTASVTRIFEAMLSDDDLTFAIHVPFLQAAYPLLITPPPDAPNLRAPPRGLRSRALLALFQVMLRMMHPSASKSPNKDKNQSRRDILLVVQIFSALASANCIPRSITTLTFQGLGAIARAPSFPSVDVEALRSTIIQALVLSCLKWGRTWWALMFLSSSLGVDLNAAVWKAKGNRLTQRGKLESSQRSPPPALSPAMSNLVHQVALNLLVPPYREVDFENALAVVKAYTDIHHRFPGTMLPVSRLVMERLNKAASELYQGSKDAVQIYLRLRQLSTEEDRNSPPPNRLVAAGLLELYTKTGDDAAALHLIHSVLTQDSHMQSDQTVTATGGPDMEPEFIVAVARAGHTASAYELWRRADQHWKGYPKAHICGSRLLVKAIVEHSILLEREEEAALSLPMTRRNFADCVLKTFQGIQFRGQPPTPEDVETFSQCSEILGRGHLRRDGIDSKDTRRTKA